MEKPTSPLPSIESSQFQDSGLGEQTDAMGAYRRILEAEAQVAGDEEDEDLIAARVAGFLLLELCARRHILGSKAYLRVAQEIISQPLDAEHDVVFSVGRHYRDHLIRSFRSPFIDPCLPSIPPPPPSSHFYKSSEDMIRAYLELPENGYKTSKKKALARDGFRCMVTGMFDSGSEEANAELRRQSMALVSMPVVLESVHILGEPRTYYITKCEENPLTETHSSILEILGNFGLEILADALREPDGIHKPWNLLSLEYHVHSQFVRSYLWFESIGEPNRYEICCFDVALEGFLRRMYVGPEMPGNGAPILVDFSPVCEGVQPPHPQLLALHAVCARVVHMSGVGEFLDKLDQDPENQRLCPRWILRWSAQ